MSIYIYWVLSAPKVLCLSINIQSKKLEYVLGMYYSVILDLLYSSFIYTPSCALANFPS